jgi:hypothetical protein
MKKFLAIYIGTPEALERARWNSLSDAERKQREKQGFDAWVAWGAKHAASIVEQGGPLGKTKRMAPEGLSDIKNVMAAYVVIQAESHEAAAKIFEKHPHFTFFPGDSVEIMECLPMPGL